jgi:LSD1 subclass zinc finger protein
MLLSDGCKECHHVLAAHYASGPKKFWCSICEALNGLKAP